jgi:hypothetical protein
MIQHDVIRVAQCSMAWDGVEQERSDLDNGDDDAACTILSYLQAKRTPHTGNRKISQNIKTAQEKSID